MKKTIIQKAEEFAIDEYKKNDSAHQWKHIKEVMKRALEIAKKFKDIDYESLKLAIIFHDIDYSSYENHVEDSIKIAEEFLKENDYPNEKIKKIKEMMLNHSTPHRKKFGKAKLIEGKIIYDADKSIFIKNLETYNKYFPLLYLNETKKLVKNLK